MPIDPLWVSDDRVTEENLCLKKARKQRLGKDACFSLSCIHEYTIGELLWCFYCTKLMLGIVKVQIYIYIGFTIFLIALLKL